MTVTTGTHRVAWSGIDQHCAVLEVELNICENRTKPEMKDCEIAKRTAEKFRETVMIQLYRGKGYMNRDEIDNAFLGGAIVNLKKYRTDIANKCPAVEVCQQAKQDLKYRQSNLQQWRDVKDYDPMMMREMEADIEVYKYSIISRCNASDVCTMAKNELNLANNSIAYEMKTSPMNRTKAEKHGQDYRQATDLVISSCNTTEVCSHVRKELHSAEESLQVMIKSVRTNANVIADFEAYIAKMKKANSDICETSGARSLAKVARRFLAKLIKH